MRRIVSSCVCSSATWQRCLRGEQQRRGQTRVPNKGYRTRAPVPDRLKDAMSYFGGDMNAYPMDDKTPYIPSERRQLLMNNLMSRHEHLRSSKKLDRLNNSLMSVRYDGPTSETWREVYLFLRSSGMCCELEPRSDDIFPKGEKLYVDFDVCEVKRTPVLMRMPNEMIILPVFSMEAYCDHYFFNMGEFEWCYLPRPHTGELYEEFCKNQFPVLGIGNLQQMSALATIAVPGQQFAILINPGQPASKFITYPEMVELAKLSRMRVSQRTTRLERTASHDATGNEEGEKPHDEQSSVPHEVEMSIFDPHLIQAFNTSKAKFKRVRPHEVSTPDVQGITIPYIAQMELHLLLHPYEAIASVYIRTVERPRWRTMLRTAAKMMTQIDIVCFPDQRPPSDFLSHLQRWSFMREFDTDVHIELTNKVPSSAMEGQEGRCVRVYTAEDGALLRAMHPLKPPSVAEAVGYSDPLVAADGSRPFET